MISSHRLFICLDSGMELPCTVEGESETKFDAVGITKVLWRGIDISSILSKAEMKWVEDLFNKEERKAHN